MIDELRFIEKDLDKIAQTIFEMQGKVGTQTSLIGQDLTNTLRSLEDALMSIRLAISDLSEENKE